MNRLLKSCWLGTLLFAAACSSTTDPNPGPGGGGSTAEDDCTDDAAPVTAGVSLDSAQGYHFELTELVPASPVQISTTPGNHWVVRVTDADGAPVTDATLNVTTFMPVHMHPGPPAAAVEEGDGNYGIDDLFLPMPGLYSITLSLAPAKGDRQSVALPLCLRVANQK